MSSKESEPKPVPPKEANDPAGEASKPVEGPSFPIVGIGASAGGLEAFTGLLKHLPLDTGMGFVLVQHLDPQHESALTQILGRATSLPLREVTNNLRVEANHIYVIPPNTNLGIAQGVLNLQPRQQTRTPHRSIDFFFESLAEDQRERAIGVILSGTATDGTLGLEAIKAEGGITFAQDDSARYDSMPRSAVAAGCVDFVLSPEDIAQELARIAKHPYVASDEWRVASGEKEEGGDALTIGHSPLATRHSSLPPNGFQTILLLLRNHSGVDFSLYKSTTIQRRITRRLVLNKQYTLENYADFLRGNAKELDALYSDVLISVTSFFRNPEGFDVLKRKVFPKLLQQRGDEPFRVWVLGCSTGQEAYSVAMAFVEAAEKAPRTRKLQVFATDVNDALLDKARHGLYAKSLAQDVSPERLRRFFVEEEGGYRITKPLREMVVFARQNLISDPPFSRMDLISCRNLLIYLEPSLQKKVFPVFHYALKPEGFLLLGASESIGSFTDLFEPADKKHKIYSKKAAPTRAFQLPVKKARGEQPSTGQSRKAGTPVPMATEQREAAEGFRAELNAQREADRLIVNQFGPPGVLINADLQVLQFRGPTGAFLEPPTGKATFDVLKMAREGLMLPLRAAINKAKKENTTARKENVRVRQNGNTRVVNVEVIPLKNLRERCYLILFEDAIPSSGGRASPRASLRLSARESVTARGNARPPGKKEESRRISELETELSETRDYLQSIQEQHEATNEELQASNEEVQSANEELQSINEELETSKEELESANEELTTVNEEMTHRNAELNRLNSDLGNLQTSAKLAIVLLGRDLTIRRFSAQAEKQFNLLPTDLGRPIRNVRHNFDLPDLEQLLKEVIDTVREQEREVCDKEGRWFSLRVRPYMTLDNKVDGAVLVLVDINDRKRSEQAIAAARDYAENTIETVRVPLLVLDAELRVESANGSFYRTFRVVPAETVGKSFFDFGNRSWNIPRLRTLLAEILPQSSHVEDFQVEHDFEQLGRRTMLLNARRIADPQRQTQRILLAIEDITERQQRQQELEHARAYAEAIIRSVRDPLLVLSADLRVRTANEAFYRTFKVSATETQGHLIFELGTGQWDVRKLRELLADILPRNSSFDDFEVTHDFEGLGRRTMLVNARALRDPGEGASILVGIQDVTELLQFQAEVRRSEIRYRRLFEAAQDGVLIIDPTTRQIVAANPFMTELLGYSSAELLGKELFEIGLVEHEEASRAAFRELLEKGFIDYEDLPLQTKTGEHREVEMVGNLYDEAGERIIQCNMRDITARKRAEEALRKSEKRFAQFMQLLPGLAWIKDPDGRYVYANDAAERVFGMRRTELYGKTDQELFPPETATQFTKNDLRALASESGIQTIETLVHADAIVHHSIVSKFPVPGPDGKEIMVGGVAFDITERKQAEESLREADRRKDEFLAMLAHELRNPLAPIRNALAILQLTKGNEEAIQSAASMMDRQISQMVRLVDDLLDVSRISRGKIELRTGFIDLASGVNHAVEAARPLCESKGLNLTVTLPPQPIYLNADPIRLAQVVGNLLNNACKFTDKGGRIWLTAEVVASGEKSDEWRVTRDEKDESGEKSDLSLVTSSPLVTIRVGDTGIGIAADQLLRIFDMFTQVDTSLERTRSGLGIGLTLAKNLVELHGGTLEVHSAGLGQGSEFVVRLPVIASDAWRAASGDKQEAGGDVLATHPLPLTPKRRILVVDDNLDSAESLTMLLELTGNETRTAYDGLEAVEAAETFRPDVVLLDIGLPELNGYDVARRIREQPWGKKMVLVALTGWGQEEARRRSLEAGFNHHLTKPVDPAVLTKLLASACPY